MARYSEFFTADADVGRAASACRAAFADLKWKVEDDSGWAFFVKEHMDLFGLMFRYPVKFAVFVRERDEGGVNVELTGSIFGIGPLPKGRVRRKAAELRSLIVSALDNP